MNSTKVGISGSNRWVKLVVGPCFALAATVASAKASAADVAWVWADNPTAPAAYAPAAGYSFNSKGGANTVQRFGAGSYKVTLGGFKGDGQIPAAAAHVVAYGGGHRCNITSWTGTATAQFVNVFCYNGNAKVDGRFVVLYYDETTSSQLAGAHLYGLRSWNNLGGTNSSRRIAPGSYEVTLGRQGSYAGMGSVFVTSMHTISSYCKVSSWRKGVAASGPKDLFAKVLCFDGAGNPADAPFVTSYFANSFFGATVAKRQSAFTLATNPTAAAAYTTDPNYTFSTLTTPITSLRTAAGSYTTTLNGFQASNKTAALTIAYGVDNVSCSPVGWNGGATRTDLRTQCRNGAGAPTDSKFGVLYLTDKAIPNSAYTASTLH